MIRFTKWQRRLFSIILLCFILCSCDKNLHSNVIQIWTDCESFAFYAEMFNKEHKNIKAVVTYTKDTAHSINKIDTQHMPDIIILSYLKNTQLKHNFHSININKVDKASFYPALLDYGKVNNTQYLLPVSFNLPVIIYQESNAPSAFLQNIDIKDLLATSAKFNQKDTNGAYQKIGFVASCNEKFLWTLMCESNVDFSQSNTTFSWNDTALNKCINYIKHWTLDTNTSTAMEEDFSFKYLYMPPIKQVVSGHNLFSFVTSDYLFSLNKTQVENVDFSYLSCDNNIAVLDNLLTLGIYKKAKHIGASYKFIKWFFDKDTQTRLFQSYQEQNLTTASFGIAEGFSSIREVNEECLCQHYEKLVAKTDFDNMLQLPNIMSNDWLRLKENVIIPYLKDACNTEVTTSIPLEERLSIYQKQSQ